MGIAVSVAKSQVEELVVEVFEHWVEPIPVTDERGQLGGRCTNAVLRLRSSNGAEGQALVGGFGDDPTGVILDITKTIGPILVGRDLSHRGWLWHELDRITGHGAALDLSWAWIDIALWDLAGKIAQMPICDLLGKTRDSVPVLATYPPRHGSPDGFVEEALRLVDEGASAVKTHPGRLPISAVGEATLNIRNQLGEDVTLVLDANNGYDVEEALRVSEALDRAQYSWFEDPFPATRYSGLDRIISRTKTPIAIGDEGHLRFRERVHLMEGHALPIIRASSRHLGVTGVARLIAVAESLDRRCEIGVGGNASANAANLHLATVAASSYYEHWLPAYAHQFGATSYLEPGNGETITPSVGAGLGVLLDEDWIEHHRIDRIVIRDAA